MIGVLIAALVVASALLSSCGADASSAGADVSQGSGADATATQNGAKDPADDSATSPQAGGETNERGETDPEDPVSASSSSAKNERDDEGFTWADGKLVKPDDKFSMDASFLFAADKGDIFTVNGDFDVTDRNGEPLDKSSLKAGAQIRVEYNVVLESYPGQISPRTVQVMDEGDDMVGFYLSIIDAVWKDDAGLNPGKDGMLAIDVEDVGNLTAGEKNALVWLAGTHLDIWSLASTFEKLEDEGYIDGRLLQFKEEDGMIIEISTSDIKEGSFKFKISKWVSGLGADWYDDCTASKTNGTWNFELGGFAIS
jgi:hypothetical protein